MEIIDLQLDKEEGPFFELVGIGAITLIPDKETHLIDVRICSIPSKEILNLVISIDFLPYLVTGLIFSKNNEVVKQPIKRLNTFKRLDVILKKNETYNLIKLGDIKNSNDLTKLKLSKYQWVCKVQCNFNNYNEINFLFPSVEIARFFLFKGQKITRSILSGIYNDHFENIETNKESKFQEFNVIEGYSTEEERVIAWLAYSSKASECADYIFNALSIESKKSIKCNFPINIDCTLSVLGKFIDKDNKYFLVNQIRGCDRNYTELNEIQSGRLGPDHRNNIGDFENKSTKIHSRIKYNNEDEIGVTSEFAPNSKAEKQKLNKFKLDTDISDPLNEIIYKKHNKINLKGREKIRSTILNSLKTEFSNNENGEIDSNFGRIDHDNDFVNDQIDNKESINYKDYFTEMVEILESREMKITYLDKNQEFSKSKQLIINNFYGYRVAILCVQFATNKYTYLFELLNRSMKHNYRLRMFHVRDYSSINAIEIETILNKIFKIGNKSKQNLLNNHFGGALRERGFNHFYNDRLLTVKDFTNKLISYINTLI